MATMMNEHELEVLPELEAEFESAGFGEHAYEAGFGEHAYEYEGGHEMEDEAFLGGLLGGIGQALGLGEHEDEWESEDEGEWEMELNPVRRVYPDAVLEMEHLGHAAAEAESEQEAGEAFLPLIPLALKALPMVFKAGKAINAVSKAAPTLMRGMRTIGRGLARNRRTRPLARAMPTVARRTTLALARRAQAGRPITPAVARRVLAQQARATLTNPQTCAHVLRRARTIDRQYHRQATGGGTPGTAACPTCGRARTATCPTCGR